MMHHSPIIHFVCKASWIITALASIHMGLNYFNINLLDNPNVMKFAPYINLIVGIAGVISLIMLVMWCMCKHQCDCGKSSSNCTCKC
jgi:uncharacterized membrane protein YuzA (DUF378 family)